MSAAQELLQRLRTDTGFRIDTVVDNNPASVAANWNARVGEDLNARGLKQALRVMADRGKMATVTEILAVPWIWNMNNAVDAALNEGNVYPDTLNEARADIDLETGRGLQQKFAFLAVLPILSNLVDTALGGILNGTANRDAAREAARQQQLAAAAAERAHWYSSQNLKTILIAAGVGLVVIIITVMAFRHARKRTT